MPRPMKSKSQASHNVRVKTGCLICRRRKKKCDENKPSCNGCLRNGFDCEWRIETETKRRGALQSVAHLVELQEAQRQAPVLLPRYVSPCQAEVNKDSDVQSLPPVSILTMTNESIISRDRGSITNLHGSIVASQASPTETNIPSVPWDGSEFTVEAEIQQNDHLSQGRDTASNELTFASGPDEVMQSPLNMPNVPPSIDMRLVHSPVIDPWNYISTVCFPMGPQLSTWPSQDISSFHIINYYLQNTAVDLANGSTPDNPFLYQMVPLAFSSELMLSIIVAQGVTHGNAKGHATFLSSRDSHYAKSLRSLQRHIGKYISGDRNGLLELAAGVLAMCMIEATRGDTKGACFDHVLAARLLMHDLLSLGDTRIPSPLKSFLLECYIYVAASSSLHSSTRHEYQLLISNEIAEAGHELVNVGYIGNLSGCWLAVLLLIPRVADFRHQYRTCVSSNAEPGIELMVTFAELHAELVQWAPDPSVAPDVVLAGKIYHQAAMVFLLSAVAKGRNGFLSGSLDMTLTKHISQGLEYISKLPLSARLNTNLCWPITVFGSCLDDPHQQEIARRRLISSRNLLGFQNIAGTLSILEHMWMSPEDERGPWKIPYIMDVNNLWITFA